MVRWGFSMRFLFFFMILTQGSLLALNQMEYESIGKKIWKNECNCKIEGLCSWNEGEEFASMGIGHFIWYSSNKGIYREQFPELLDFLKKNDIQLPPWLEKNRECPWKSKTEFYNAFNSNQMNELRNLLSETISLQAIFIVIQLEALLKNDSLKKELLQKFNLIKNNSKGFFALIDYLNFKGLGSSPQEQYNHEGWGLLQVLQTMPTNSQQPLEDFILSAKCVLTRRVQNSPKERNEERWLKGWFNRLDSYR